MNVEIFTVHIWHVEEKTLFDWQGLVYSGSHGLLRECEGQQVARMKVENRNPGLLLQISRIPLGCIRATSKDRMHAYRPRYTPAAHSGRTGIGEAKAFHTPLRPFAFPSRLCGEESAANPAQSHRDTLTALDTRLRRTRVERVLGREGLAYPLCGPLHFLRALAVKSQPQTQHRRISSQPVGMQPINATEQRN